MIQVNSIFLHNENVIYPDIRPFVQSWEVKKTFDHEWEWKSWSEQLEDATPQKILAWASRRFGKELTLGTGLGPSGIVLMHMLREITATPTIFMLDTELHFEQTYALVSELEAKLDLHIELVRPTQSVAQQAAQHGATLWQNQPDLCCQLRKVAPLRTHLAQYNGWITGLRRDQGPTRSNTPIVRYVRSYDVVKVCPLATWTREMVWDYIHDHQLPFNSLHKRGYPSIGCYPCTKSVRPHMAERAGRWVGASKIECGLHTV